MIEFEQKTRLLLKNQDCMDLMKELPDNFVDLIVTDSPYKIATSGGSFVGKRDVFKDIDFMSDGLTIEQLDEICRVMKKINVYMFCSRKQIPFLYDYFVKEKKCNWNLLTLHKTNPVPACGNKYLSDTQYIMFFREQGVKLGGTFETKRTWWSLPFDKKLKDKYKHPSIKPVEVLENLIINSSSKGDVVLDPFMGVGSTGVACLKLGRRFIGYEIDKEYYNIAEQRLIEELKEARKEREEKKQ